jgi:glucose-6-phosphate isomerase
VPQNTAGGSAKQERKTVLSLRGETALLRATPLFSMNTWKRFQQHYHEFSPGGDLFAIDLSRARVPRRFWISEDTARLARTALAAMRDLEKGAVANPDEKRMVGHYWLRAPELAPTPELAAEITRTLGDVERFAARVHEGETTGAGGARFENVLCIGIGGSALGPQFVGQALANLNGRDKTRLFFLDNTDPAGMDETLSQIGDANLSKTLAVVISKSGGTPETRNGMLVAKARYEAAGLRFGDHAVAITDLTSVRKDPATGAVLTDPATGGPLYASSLKRFADAEKFLAQFPMWDWVGGRTSQLAAVGLLPAALQGIDIRGLLAGAADMDTLTRSENTLENPALLLALSWFFLTRGRGARDMVILPYKDRLQLFARYLQQLIMESLGKGADLDGKPVKQGIAVYGNKGSTDQHAFVQQLREGVDNFFVTFVEVLRDAGGDASTLRLPLPAVSKTEAGEKLRAAWGGEAAYNALLADGAQVVSSGDYLQGFLLGTRDALTGNARPSITLTVGAVTARAVGMLIALFERAVGFYATFVHINAYNQPGVEAGKLAAGDILHVQALVERFLAANAGKEFTARKIAEKLALDEKTEIIFKVCEHLAANPAKCVAKKPHTPFYLATFQHT